MRHNLRQTGLSATRRHGLPCDWSAVRGSFAASRGEQWLIVAWASGSRSEKRRHAIICTVNAFCRDSIHIGIINNGVRLCLNTLRPKLLDYVNVDFLNVSLIPLFAAHCVLAYWRKWLPLMDLIKSKYWSHLEIKCVPTLSTKSHLQKRCIVPFFAQIKQ